MIPLIAGGIVFVCTFIGAQVGMKLRAVLSESYFEEDSRDTVKVAVGLISTLTAMVLGFVLASAKNSFEVIDRDIKQSAAEVLSLDRCLAQYGPESAEVRVELKRYLAEVIASISPGIGSRQTIFDPFERRQEGEMIAAKIRSLVPKTDNQRLLHSRAVETSESLLTVRWMMVAYADPPVHGLFLGILLFWLTIIFTSFGLLTHRNTLVVMTLFLCAVSVAASVFLILELASPFEGLIRVSSSPFNYALSHLNR
jgi:hypothetical protein